ncbi:MAG: Holliday junction branch migration protein RuvA [Thiotrichales bacterium]|nr:Holliday junction branch migration protein RuvA [Thiotrichales bacterium]
MIAWMHGVLREKHPPLLLVDIGGVGYEMEAPMTTFYDLPATGEPVTLHLHHVVRDDAQNLYAFARRAERDLFRQLLRVSGVGARLGLAILSGMDAGRFSRCVLEGDGASLSRLPGIGKKTAERLIMEMRDRIEAESTGVTAVGTGTGAAPPAQRDDPVAEAVRALIALGLKPPEASRRVHAVGPDGLACEEIVRRALQSMVR